MSDRQARIKALAEQSSYVENVLRHILIGELSSCLWARHVGQLLQVFNAEVDNSGFDIVLTVGSESRYIQLKQCHSEKLPPKVSIRNSFSEMPGSCVVLVAHALSDLRPVSYSFYGAELPTVPMPAITQFTVPKAPGRRTAGGERKLKTNYREVPLRLFSRGLGIDELLAKLFPSCAA